MAYLRFSIERAAASPLRGGAARSFPDRGFWAPIAALAVAFLLVLGAGRPSGFQRPLQASETGPPTDVRFEPAAIQRTFVDGGLWVRFTVDPISASTQKTEVEADSGRSAEGDVVAGDDVRIRFELRDERTAEPIRGLHPLAWIDGRQGDGAPTTAEVRERIGSYLGGLLSRQADVDLNSYRIFVLNHDATISVLNPLVSFSRSKLEKILPLPAQGNDLVFAPDGDRLTVTMRDVGLVSIVDPETLALLATLPLGYGTSPGRPLCGPEGRSVWIGLDGTDSVAMIDLDALEVVDRVSVGEGPHRLALVEDEGFVAVASRGSSTVTILDAAERRPVARAELDGEPVDIAYGSASDRVWVVLEDGGIRAIDPRTGRVTARVAGGRGPAAIAFEPEGRFGFVALPDPGRVQIFDSAGGEVIATFDTAAGSDEIAFTERFGFLRGSRSTSISVLDLAGLPSGRPVPPIDVTVSRLSSEGATETVPGASMSTEARGPRLVPTPDDNAVLVANPAERNLAYYVEGMLAPMGNFKTYDRYPVALACFDRSLVETEPGVYSTTAKLGKAGLQDVFFVVDQPRVIRHLEFEVALPEGVLVEGETADGEVRLALPNAERRSPADAMYGQPYDLRVALAEADSGEPVRGLTDVRVLVMTRTATVSRRYATEELEPGLYGVRVEFYEPGFHAVLVRSDSRGLTYENSPLLDLRVLPGDPGKAEQERRETDRSDVDVDVEEDLEEGRAIYETGRPLDGPAVRVVLGAGGSPLPGASFACANCHGEFGEGLSEGGLEPPSIRWRDLVRSRRSELTGRTREAYDRTSLARSIREGSDPEGRAMHPGMPRYRMTDRQLDALLDYLETLGEASEAGRGVDADRVRIGTVVPRAGQAAESGREVLASLERRLTELNESGGLYGRSIELVSRPSDGGAAGTDAAIRALVEDDRVFAVVAPLGFEGSDSLDRLLEKYGTSVIGPVRTPANDRDVPRARVYETLPSLDVHARVLVDEALERSGVTDATIALVLAAGPGVDSARRAAIDQARLHGLRDPLVVDLDAGDTLPTSPRPDAWIALGPGTASRCIEAARSSSPGTQEGCAPLFVAGGAAAAGLFESRSETNGGRSSATICMSLGSRAGTGRAALPRVAADSLEVFLEGLRGAGRRLAPDALRDAIERVRTSRPTVLPPIAFGPGEPRGAHAVYLADLDPERRGLRVEKTATAPLRRPFRAQESIESGRDHEPRSGVPQGPIEGRSGGAPGEDAR